ncbi:sarcosine oxidase subunit delta [Mesorhizobium sp.]|uniref:sarcosine oxidase subunit delta n=1 Tax=Mesorhizobium sp. TaxID=1871066 RepID=UPI000FE43A28|nr:sarcosine oxidase subunit delta [Mesorhizobium sp.]RWH95489.1 MAG: sarcosine oxidase subunit delta [Mesorhizobium sp.]RWK17675.1 MAG: sarcosine oxidase subunit delta [Mesorhizobium sp.]RWK27581.1 MAG: sarcosine oxidase subunit delta [Mesorhizobium sp.]RWM21388.1 MAG: sarcosine oxidase subunit delta [Mesorhizobium sp.]
MASLINCPHCSARPADEFTIKGAVLKRPKADANAEAWMDYVYLRNNPRGRHREYWHHTSGCRRWIIVERDTATHEIFGTFDAALGAPAEVIL